MKQSRNRSTEHCIKIEHLTVSYNRRPVLWDIDVTIPAGKLVAIVGPNGAGKSTFMKSMLNIVPRISGNISFFGQEYKQYRSNISYMSQRKEVDWEFPIDVLKLVTMGLYKRTGWFRPLSLSEKKEINTALEKVGMLPYANHQISQLSGGQQQRVFMARALVENADVYCMDEPFAGVDATTEKAIFTLLKELRMQKKTVIVVHHNIDMIRDNFDYVVLLNLRLVAAGNIKEAFTEENLTKTYRGRLTLLDYAAGEVIRKR